MKSTTYVTYILLPSPCQGMFKGLTPESLSISGQRIFRHENSIQPKALTQGHKEAKAQGKS